MPPTRPPKKSEAKNIVPMILKTFNVIETLRSHPEGITYSELIKCHPEIPRISIYRIVCSLETVGYLQKDEKTSKYLLGSKFIELGRLIERRQDIIRILVPYMEQVVEQFDETVNLYKIENYELINLKSIEGTHPLRVIELHNRRNSIHSSASGKAIMAYMDEEARTELLQRLDFLRLTPATITSVKEMTQELDRILRRGFAYDNEENLIGVRCVSTAIRNLNGEPLAAVSVTAPAMRMPDERAEEIGRYMSRLSGEITQMHFGFH